MHIRDAKRLDRLAQVGVVADDKGDVGDQLSRLPLPKKFKQTMLGFGDKNRDSPNVVVQPKLPTHLKFSSDRGKRRFDLFFSLGDVRAVELQAEKKPSLPQGQSSIGSIQRYSPLVRTETTSLPRRCPGDLGRR